jgi:hypothetical protein
MVVNSINTHLNASGHHGNGSHHAAAQKDASPECRSEPLKALEKEWKQIEIATDRVKRRLAVWRRKVSAIVCSSTWLDDCYFRGKKYVPDFRCNCALCTVSFPHRLHPRSTRESTIATDCQLEGNVDEDLAEDLARLRNDRPRIGSAFITTRRIDRGTGTSRRNARAQF